jgi:hypothetical protein
MNTTKEQVAHTPGPWHLGEPTIGNQMVLKSPGRSIARVMHCDEAEANARLIAAAPDLLIALARAHNDLLFMEDRDERTIDIVRAALAKATK